MDFKKDFKCMKHLNTFIKNILKEYKENEDIDNVYIRELIKYHPTKDLHNIKWLRMKKQKKYYNNLSLQYGTNEIESDDISWNECIRNIFGKYDINKNKIRDVEEAFKNIINTGTKKFYKLKNDNVCCICENLYNIETDHKDIPYIKILDDFRIENNIDTLINIEIYEDKNDMIQLKDKTLHNKWLKYHDDRANYQLLCKTCNIKKGSSKYKSKYKKKEVDDTLILLNIVKKGYEDNNNLKNNNT